ncbi:hypothetical protein BHM03_00048823 [Ensete ventricosum]|nr:hypothetical protein BHM03_00048823 [Ensete ventricosum]
MMKRSNGWESRVRVKLSSMGQRTIGGRELLVSESRVRCAAATYTPSSSFGSHVSSVLFGSDLMALPNQQTVDYPSFKLVLVGDGGTGEISLHMLWP